MEKTFRRERKKPVSEMNVVPYIDVMLVLLVIFMVTAPMLTQGVKVELPKAVTDNLTLKNREPLVISIKQDGSYWLKQGSRDDRQVSREDLKASLKEALLATPEAPVLVNGDSRVNYGTVITLMASLQKAGVPNVGLLTQAESDAARDASR
ncbi:MAG: tolR [Moraxellaceae bacterium]|jgi:biopolymer transport protein TolR|nr:tolR [Moraxellaceae bacterium]MDF3029611.1 tolR [Moraxellaceae bacterium]